MKPLVTVQPRNVNMPSSILMAIIIEHLFYIGEIIKD